MVVVDDDNAKLLLGDKITVFYNDVGQSVKYKIGTFIEFTSSFIILKCNNSMNFGKVRVRIPRYKIIRIEEEE